MQVTKEGSVRVDLVGGTLDIEPINLILKNVVTLNVATSLKAKVTISKTDFDGIQIYSRDYQKEYSFTSSDLTLDNVLYTKKFQEMTFILQILNLFGINKNVRLELSSGAPAGSGLGGSSAMGVTLYKALCEWTQTPFDVKKTVLRVKGVESRILNQGVAGYQDYFPALVGGILNIKGIEGDILVEQLYSPELKKFLEENVSLIYSGQSRASGINNWEVYKGFFDKRPEVVEGLTTISEHSYNAYTAIKNKNYPELLRCIGLEGEAREKLFPTIVTDKIKEFFESVKKESSKACLKMCGAGGGGCFILIHPGVDEQKLLKLVKEYHMEKLPFQIEAPL